MRDKPSSGRRPSSGYPALQTFRRFDSQARALVKSGPDPPPEVAVPRITRPGGLLESKRPTLAAMALSMKIKPGRRRDHRDRYGHHDKTAGLRCRIGPGEVRLDHSAHRHNSRAQGTAATR